MLTEGAETGSLTIIWDRHYTRQRPADYLADIAPLVEHARKTAEVLIISDIRQLLPSENVPDPAFDAAITRETNSRLAELYPEHVVDVAAVLEPLETRGADCLHLSQAGIDAVANALAQTIRARMDVAEGGLR